MRRGQELGFVYDGKNDGIVIWVSSPQRDKRD